MLWGKKERTRKLTKKRKNRESRTTKKWTKKTKKMIHLCRQALTRLAPRAALQPPSRTQTESHRQTKAHPFNRANLPNNLIKRNKSPFLRHPESSCHLQRNPTVAKNKEHPLLAAAATINSKGSARPPNSRPQMSKSRLRCRSRASGNRP